MLREFRRNFSFSGEQINRVKYSTKKNRLFQFEPETVSNKYSDVSSVNTIFHSKHFKTKVQLENTIQGYSKFT